MKSRICTTLAAFSAGLDIGVNGTGDDLRYIVSQRVHAGPKDTMDRTVDLVLDNEEALDLAISLLKQVPVSVLEEKKDKTRAVVAILSRTIDANLLPHLNKTLLVPEADPLGKPCPTRVHPGTDRTSHPCGKTAGHSGPCV